MENQYYFKRLRDKIYIIPKSEIWGVFEESLQMFSDDFMEGRDQPPCQIRESFD